MGYTQAALIADLSAAGFGPGAFDIFYLPFVLAQRVCQGYVVLNFKDSDTATAFQMQFNDGRVRFGRFHCQLCVVPAERQGRAENLPRLAKVASKIKNPKFAPLVLTPQGNLVPVTTLAS